MKSFFSVTLLTICLSASLALAQQPGLVPKLINYQGKLVQANGVDPLEAGTYVLRFELFDKAATPAAGAPPQTLVWGEQQQVVVTGGIFHVMLGAPGATPLVGTAVNDLGFAFGSADRFLQTTIVSGPAGAINQTLAPRQQLASVPFAVAAQNAAQAQQSVNSENLAGQPPTFWLPPGMISAYGGASDPAGWLICDGRAVSRSDYPELFAVVGTTFGAGDSPDQFNLPDTRGLVLRSTGTQSIEGRAKVGPALGARQEDQLQGHRHGIFSYTANNFFDHTTTNVSGGGASRTEGNVITGNPISDGVNGAPRSGSETRVASLGVRHIIKY